MNLLLRWMSEIGIAGFFDIGIMALLTYGLLVWLQKTRRAGLILGGFAILGGVYMGAVYFQLVLTGAVLRAFFAIFVIVLVVIFQEELRQLFEQIAKWGLSRALAGRRPAVRPLHSAEVGTLADTLSDLARNRIGALIVIIGHDPIERHVDGGIEVNGNLSEALLKSIFDPHSIGHDGAVTIARGKIEKFGVRLPFTRDAEALGPLGTRHAAALGLSERVDALCLLASEEKGTVSVARNGRLDVIQHKERLYELIESYCRTLTPEAGTQAWHAPFVRNYREKIASIGIAAGLWFMIAYRAEIVSAYFTVTVESSSTPAELFAVQITPSAVEARVSGPRRLLGRVQAREIKLNLSITNLTRGFQMVPISERQFTLPAGLELIDFRPRQIYFNIDQKLSPPTNP